MRHQTTEISLVRQMEKNLSRGQAQSSRSTSIKPIWNRNWWNDWANRDFSQSESDNSSIFGNNRISISDNSGFEVSTTPAAGPRQSDLVNIVFTWNLGGNEAFLIGSFTKWSERLPMNKIGGNEFTLLKTLERGVHQYKFIVDGNWRFASDQPTMRDGQGNINNFIDTTHYASSSAPS